MATVDPDTNDDMEFVRYEIDPIYKLLDLENSEIKVDYELMQFYEEEDLESS